MNDVMIDLETLGKGSDAHILQIGACYFDRLTGKIGETYNHIIDASSMEDSGARMDASTVMWWLGQSEDARLNILNASKIKIDVALSELNFFMAEAKQIWSHATFDFPILMDTYQRLKIRPNFDYRMARDIRTLEDLAGKENIICRERSSTHHDALADCIYQVLYCSQSFRVLEDKK